MSNSVAPNHPSEVSRRNSLASNIKHSNLRVWDWITPGITAVSTQNWRVYRLSSVRVSQTSGSFPTAESTELSIE